ncbi:MAG: hypothetical protein LBI70_00600, partial [Rickettsiales bacterium]|nr:hypothetical protein [Rickettsiales bacterium]
MKINGFLILCLVALTVIGVCCQASSFENGGYKYYKNSRQPVADKDLPEEASNKGVDAAMTVLNAFPGFSVLAPPISYLVLVAKLTVDENKSSE